MIDHSGVTLRENTVINLSAIVCMREIITTQLQNSHSSALCCSSQCSMCKPLQNFCCGSIHLFPIYLFHWVINKASHKALSQSVGHKTDPSQYLLTSRLSWSRHFPQSHLWSARILFLSHSSSGQALAASDSLIWLFPVSKVTRQ